MEYPGIEPDVLKAADLQSTASPLMLLLHCILKHTIIYDATLDSESSRFKYVLEYPVLPQDMIGLIPYPGVLLMRSRHTFMYPVRPFRTY